MHKRSLFLILIALLLIGCDVLPINPPTTAPRQATAVQLNCGATISGGKYPNLPTVPLRELLRCRPQVGDTLTVILAGGPFRYSQDDATFQNRERLLPAGSMGTYREYTVITPGASTRGARRLVTSGAQNRRPGDYLDLYYTDDHYETFLVVVE